MTDPRRRQAVSDIILTVGMKIRDLTLIEEKPFFFPNRQRPHAGGWLVQNEKGEVKHIETVNLKRFVYRTPAKSDEKGSPGKSTKGIKLQSGQRIRDMVLIKTVSDEKGNHFWEVEKDNGEFTKVLSCSLKRSLSSKELCGSEASTVNWKLKHYKKSATERGYAFELDRDYFKSLLFSDCTYCGTKPNNHAMYRQDGQGILVNGVDRIDNAVGYTKSNTCTACSTCNYAKRDQSALEFTTWIDNLVAFRLKQKGITK